MDNIWILHYLHVDTPFDRCRILLVEERWYHQWWGKMENSVLWTSEPTGSSRTTDFQNGWEWGRLWTFGGEREKPSRGGKKSTGIFPFFYVVNFERPQGTPGFIETSVAENMHPRSPLARRKKDKQQEKNEWWLIFHGHGHDFTCSALQFLFVVAVLCP